MLYDTHAHIDLYKNRAEVIEYIEASRLYTIAVTNLPELYIKYRREYSDLKYVRFALGLHPELAIQYHGQVSVFLQALPHSEYIGEIGLDFYRNISEKEKECQLFIFHKIIDACKQDIHPKVLSIHSRNSAKNVIDIVGHYHGKVILHWPSCSLNLIRLAINHGYYFSINAQMLDSTHGKRITAIIPLEQILLESDAPFSKGFHTVYNTKILYETLNKIAEIKQLDRQDTATALWKNFKMLFDI